MLNFADYLHRLGFKTGHQPVLLDTVQPVVVVGNLPHLVSRPMLSSYLVGGAVPPTIATFATVLVSTPVPLHLKEIVLAMSTTSQIGVDIGVAPPPAQAAVTVITPRLFDATQPAKAVWTTGDDGAGIAIGQPTYSVGTQSNIIVHDLWVPAGGWLEFRCGSVTNTIRWTAVVDEYPNETPN